MKTVRIIISGKVQGVFFRSSMKKIAEENHVVGWVRNLGDGRVEALVQGDHSDVAKLLVWCKVGPPRAAVSNVNAKDVEPQDELRNFSILY